MLRWLKGVSVLGLLAVGVAIAGTSIASGGSLRGAQTVELVAGAAVGHPGGRIGITVVNGTSHSIRFRPCLQLARRAARTWRPVINTSGRVSTCPTAALSVGPRSRRGMTLDLADRLSPALYQVSLTFRAGSRQGVAHAYITVSAACAFPSGATTLARTRHAIIASLVVAGAYTGQTNTELLGCARTRGRVHVLQTLGDSSGEYSRYTVMVALAGASAALGVQYVDAHYGDTELTLTVFALGTGRRVAGGDGNLQSGGGYGDTGEGSLRSVVVDSVGDAGSLFTQTVACPPSTPPSLPGAPCTQETIDASDSTGLHAVDTVLDPYGAAPVLAGLTLTGRTLSWRHAGTSRSVVLH